jgi:hypothetical protein
MSSTKTTEPPVQPEQLRLRSTRDPVSEVVEEVIPEETPQIKWLPMLSLLTQHFSRRVHSSLLGLVPSSTKIDLGNGSTVHGENVPTNLPHISTVCSINEPIIKTSDHIFC